MAVPPDPGVAVLRARFPGACGGLGDDTLVDAVARKTWQAEALRAGARAAVSVRVAQLEAGPLPGMGLRGRERQKTEGSAEVRAATRWAEGTRAHIVRGQKRRGSRAGRGEGGYQLAGCPG